MTNDTNLKNKAAAFWGWFAQNEATYRKTAVAENDLRVLQTKLHGYNEKLTAELEGPKDDAHQLVITALGDRDSFKSVARLVAGAPTIEHWKIISFRQAKGFDRVTEHKGVRIDPRETWYLPLTSESNTTALGLRVGIKNLSPNQAQAATDAAWVVVDEGLGEKRAGDEVLHIEVVPEPADPKAEDYLKLSDLSNFISWNNTHTCEAYDPDKKGQQPN